MTTVTLRVSFLSFWDLLSRMHVKGFGKITLQCFLRKNRYLVKEGELKIAEDYNRFFNDLTLFFVFMLSLQRVDKRSKNAFLVNGLNYICYKSIFRAHSTWIWVPFESRGRCSDHQGLVLNSGALHFPHTLLLHFPQGVKLCSPPLRNIYQFATSFILSEITWGSLVLWKWRAR